MPETDEIRLLLAEQMSWPDAAVAIVMLIAFAAVAITAIRRARL